MQKNVIASIIVVCLALAGCQKITYNSKREIKNITKSIVRISTEYIVEDKITLSPTKREYVASGFSIVVQDNVSYVLTNQHVCSMRGTVPYTLITQAGQKIKARFIRVDSFADICLLQADGVIPPLELSRNNATYGEKVISIGAPDGVFPVVVDGVISGYYDMHMKNDPDEDGMFEVHFRSQVMSTPVYQGASGSPVLDTNENVVGIVFAVHGDKEHISYMVPISEVWRFLDMSEYVTN